MLGLPESFEIDKQDLDDRWKARAAQVHPDRFAAASAAEKRVAMQWSAQVNEAYRVLRDPVSRARYICELNGHPVGDRPGGQLPAEFLEQQMAWRESLEDIRETLAHAESTHTSMSGSSRRTLQALNDEVDQARESCIDQVSRMLSAQCWPQAAASLQQWMFVDKFQQEISRIRRQVDASSS